MSVKRLFLAGLLLLSAASAYADDEQSNHSAAFLRAGVDARHLAMGGVGAALANDIASGYWNPAGLANIRGLSLTGMATHGLNFDRHHNYVAIACGVGAALYGCVRGNGIGARVAVVIVAEGHRHAELAAGH